MLPRIKTLLIVALVLVCCVPAVGWIMGGAGLLALGAVTEHQSLLKSHHSHENGIPLAADAVAYGDTMLFVAASGYGSEVAAGEFAGIVKSDAINTGGANGDVSAEVYEDGRFLLTGAGLVQADLKKKAYASDNFTITNAPGGAILIGTFDEIVSATQAWVLIKNQAV